MHLICDARWRRSLLFLFLIPLLGAAEGSFQADVQRLKFWQKRDKASLIALDKLGEELLSQYQKPQQQGEIYYYLTHHHAQGGLVFPQKAIDYANKALAYPVTPDQKMRLCVYRGDAFQVVDRKKPFTERRREAVASYLQGLKDLKSFQLPDTPPDVPNTPPQLVGPQGTEQEMQQAQRKFREEQRKYLEARERAEFTRTMIMHRGVLQGQIASLYGRRPLATEELKDTASKILGEGKELDRLMAAVDAKIAKLPPEDKNSQTAAPMTPSTPRSPRSKYRTLGLLIGSGVFLILAIGLLSWRIYRTDQEKTGSPPKN